ncbi:Taurine dioxygenase, alpha-ketoglutarate-dependent [Planctomycetales bacterium 10988]|nr:Taurine dioxygenase, alpha-ketoglutarate-dependent [Planctomycetales bacterium 10988]
MSNHASLEDLASKIQPIEVEGQQHYKESDFPYVYQCQAENASLDTALAWVEGKRDALLEEATKHGAVLLRDFPFPTVEDFDAYIQALSLPNFPYKKSLSNAVRVNRTERVFSANEAPPEVQIFFHHEMAQTPLFPRWIMFYCEIAPEKGGATPLCRSDVLYDRLKEACPKFIEDCETKGLLYTNVMPDEDDPKSGMGRSWKSTLGVDTKEDAEARLLALGYSWIWQEDGCLKVTTPKLPAVMEVDPGRKTFFNQLIAAYSGWKDSRNDPSEAIRHGDGSKLDADAVATAIKLAEELAFDVAWQAGDAVLIDNTIVMHARRSFEGTRKVVASLACMQTQSFQSEGESA